MSIKTHLLIESTNWLLTAATISSAVSLNSFDVWSVILSLYFFFSWSFPGKTLAENNKKSSEETQNLIKWNFIFLGISLTCWQEEDLSLCQTVSLLNTTLQLAGT